MNSTEKIFEFVQAALNLFKAVPNLENETFPPYTLDNERNLANGFFVTEEAFRVCPCIAGKSSFRFLKDKFGYNLLELNQGFYKSFGTVAGLTPQKLLVNKLLHYMSTYGMENFGLFDRELVYIPNDALDLPADAKPIKITIIDAIDNAELEARTFKMIQSGAALSDDTLDSLITVIKFLALKPNLDDVPNKELQVRLRKLFNIMPADPVQFLRLMIYIASGSTLLIKDDETIRALRAAKTNFDEYFAAYIKANGLNKLAGIFHRFKPLWLAFKPHSDYMRSTINKMRKLADRYHKPLAPKFLERLTSSQAVDLDRLKSELANVTTYKKISLANAILYRQTAPDNIIYNIRNGKAFVDDYLCKLKFDAQTVLDTIVDSIAEDIKPNVQGKRIYIPESFTYAAPVSEKRFVSNIPYGSSYTFASKSVVVGVHWFNAVTEKGEHRVDLDLHLNSERIDIGWQNDFADENFINTRERKVIFSGDMTDAPIASGGATEAFFVGEGLASDMLMVNLNYYNRRDEKPLPFKLILADVNREQIDRKYLLNSHEIAFCVPEEINSGEMFLGFLNSDSSGNKKFYFFARNMGKRIVAKSDERTEQILSAMSATFESFLSLNDVLKSAGAIFDGVNSSDCDINLDPAEVTKDILLGLLNK